MNEFVGLLPQIFMNSTHLTAIHRNKLPLPHLYLQNAGYIKGDVLDYGCGKCYKINPPSWDNYDPYFCPNGITKTNYDTILCCYVLNVLQSKNEIEKVIKDVSCRLKKDGRVYFTVRRDVDVRRSSIQKDIDGTEFGLKRFYLKRGNYEIYYI